MPKQNKPKYKRTDIQLATIKVPVYASPKVSDALKEVMHDMTLYKGVRLAQVMEAVFETGKKKGREEVFSQIDDVKKQLPHRAPGQPRKKRRK
jgi:hypothetical protein